MKKSLVLIVTVFLFTSLYFSGCKSDSTVAPPVTTSGELGGNWQASQVQLVHAPETGTPSAQMKAQLQALGSMPAVSVGWSNLTFGTSTKWTPQSIGGTDELGDIWFLDAQNGFIAVSYYYFQSSAHFFKTNNGGGSWNQVTIPGAYRLNSFTFMNALTGWGEVLNTNYSDVLMKTTDGGNTWNSVQDLTSIGINSFYSIYFLNDQTGIAENYNGIYRTTNGGSNWTSQSLNSGSYERIVFANSLTGWVAGSDANYNPLIRKTTDAGITWADLSTGTYISSFQFLNVNTGFTYGYTNTSPSQQLLRKTIDGGATWSTISNTKFGGIYFIDANTGYGASGNVILKTTNSGTNWTHEFCSTYYNRLSRVYMKDEQTGFFTGDEGRLWSRNGGSITNSWALTGQITNQSIINIVHTRNSFYSAGGTYTTDGSSISFTVLGFTQGDDDFADINFGTGTFGVNGNVDFTLNLANNEQWKITYKR